MSFAIFGSREEIKRVIGTKLLAIMFEARKLAVRVNVIQNVFDNKAVAYFSLELNPMAQHANYIIGEFAKLVNANEMRAVQSLLYKAQWKIVAGTYKNIT